MIDNLSHAVRILLCDACGAPFETAPEDALTTCTYCGARSEPGARDETPQRIGGDDADEAGRIARLRAQPSGALTVPKRFVAVLQSAKYTDEDKATIQAAWKEAHEAITSGRGNDGWELTLYFSTWLLWTAQAELETTRRRALAETALQVLRTPTYRHVLYCKLARAAARAGDLESAAQWLAPCDPRAEELLADSEFRASRALIAAHGGRWQDVLAALGDEPGDVPIHDSLANWLGIIRAHAHEKLGSTDRATDQLAALFGRDAPRVERLLAGDEDRLGWCAASRDAARARIAALDASCFAVTFACITCEHCGADNEIDATRQARCTYCGAISAIPVSPVVETIDAFAGTVPGAADIPAERRAKLEAQTATWVIPDDLKRLFRDGLLVKELIPDAEEAWRVALRKVAEGDRSERCVARLHLLTSTLLTADDARDAAGRRHVRAVLESVLRVMPAGSYTARLRCSMAVSAAEAGDFEAAATWLSRCDARSDDLAAFSAYVIARARIASLRKDFEECIRMLGARDGESPMQLSSRVVASVLRATALERLGRAEAAVAALMPILRWSPDARVALVRFVGNFERDGEPAPTQSLALAMSRAQRETWTKRVIAAGCVAVVIAGALAWWAR